MKAKLLTLLCALCTALCVLSGSIAVPLLVRPFHTLHIGPLGLEAASGLTRQQIREAYGQVMDYCLGLRSDFAAGVLPFSESGASHFADVRALFLLDLAVLALSAAVLLLLRWQRRHEAVEFHRFGGHGPAFWGCAGLGITFLLLGGPAALDFERSFLLFHTVFFPGKDNWFFYPHLDPVILILPPEFFRNCAVLILAVLLTVCTVLILRDLRQRKPPA